MHLANVLSCTPLTVLSLAYPIPSSDLLCHLPGRKLHFLDSLAPAVAGFLRANSTSW